MKSTRLVAVSIASAMFLFACGSSSSTGGAAALQVADMSGTWKTECGQLSDYNQSDYTLLQIDSNSSIQVNTFKFKGLTCDPAQAYVRTSLVGTLNLSGNTITAIPTSSSSIVALTEDAVTELNTENPCGQTPFQINVPQYCGTPDIINTGAPSDSKITYQVSGDTLTLFECFADAPCRPTTVYQRVTY